MKLIEGNFWSAKADLILPTVTTNSSLKYDDSLVMGAGTALQAATRFPHIPAVAGAAIKAQCGNLGRYGFLVVDGIGLFQTKQSWRNNSTLDLIRFSVEKLKEFTDNTENKVIIAMPFPGIGLGGLNPNDVLPILQKLPDSVWIFLKK